MEGKEREGADGQVGSLRLFRRNRNVKQENKKI